MNPTLILILVKLAIYPICAIFPIMIGRYTGFWKGWKFIVFGMTNPVLTVILQLVDSFTHTSWIPIIASACAMLSIISLGIGFYYILLEMRNGKH